MKNFLSLKGASLRKMFNGIADPVERALTAIYLLSVGLTTLKIAVIFPYFTENPFRITVFIVVTCLSILLCLNLLNKPNRIRRYFHFGLLIYVLYLAVSIFLLSKGINISTLQEFYLVIMWSFFGLGVRWGIVYASATIGMSVLFLASSNQSITSIPLLPPNIPFAVAMFVIVTNFIMAIFSFHAYQRAMVKTTQEKTKLNKQLHKLLDAKTDFLSTMSHELRTPLNSVIGITNLLIDDNRDESQKEDLRNLRFSAESLLLLINDILDFNKMDSHKVELETIPFNLPNLINNVCGGLKPKALEKNLHFEIATDPKLAVIEVLGDPTRLTQIIFNLVGNAIKFTETGGVKIDCDVINQAYDYITVQFTVEDTGIGIDPEHQSTIFEPFIQASRDISRKFGGTGLGLAIVHHLITLHSSTLSLESTPGIGSAFRFKLTYPLYKDRKPRRLSQSTEPDISKESLQGLRVLLAEDNSMSVTFMEKLLAKWDIVVDIAKNGQEAVEKTTISNYDVILMDLHMPVMNGIEATARIRALHDSAKSNVYILALTASVSDDIIANIRDLGFNDYLGKPFRPNDLHHKLEQAQTNNQQEIQHTKQTKTTQ